ncbi:methyltransferase domain-containing protein [Pseudoduganella sp. RAF53_2]|uniref:methyltransferase domain-containing protein n=1 Tax=unclassified Pseudoduganella TaxID=2637179 RepID=UPI003F9AF998
MPEFRTRDPLSPAFWDERFDKTFTPWDRGAAPERLRRFVTETANQVAATAWQPPALAPRVLIPGCGAGYELALLSEAGWDATAIDFSPSAVAAARQNVGTWAGRVVEADFFAYAPPKPLDVIYERAFLCAMPRHMWPQVIQRWAALLPEGARLVGYFYFDNNEKGPPFGANREELVAQLERDFVLEQDEPVEDSIPVFQGKERWMSWRRKKGL